MNIVLKVH